MENRRKFIEKLLKSTYPDKIYESIADLEDNLGSTNKKILSELTKDVNISTSDFLYELGYDKLAKYDSKRIIELINDFDVTQADIAREVFDVQRETIRQQIQKKKINNNYFWKETKLTALQKKDIVEMIQNRQWSYDNQSDKVRYLLISNHKKSSSNQVKFIVVIHNYANKNYLEATTLNIISEIEILNLLKKYGHYYISKNDFNMFTKLMKEVKEATADIDSVSVRLISKVNDFHTKTKNISERDFHQLLGINEEIEIIDKRYADENRFKNRIEQYADGDNYVYINSVKPNGGPNPDYEYLANNASRNNMSLEAFVNSFGYNFIPGNEYYKIQFQKRTKAKLKLRIVEKNKIYINSIDPLYYQLHSTATKRNQSIDDYILEVYGYVRIKKDALPSNYVPYNWAQEIENINTISESEMKTYIENYLDEEGILYLSNNDKVYRNLYAYALNNDSSPLNVLKEWNIEYRWNSKEDEKQSDEELREELLKDIKKLDSALKVETIKKNKIVRSQNLVKKLKLLYENRCQICGSDNYIPPIITANGDNYCEMHHINPIKNFNDDQSVHDESNLMIDHYQNCIIVCPHHHKVIHYENGGYTSLKKIDNMFYLVNENEEKLPLKINYHLS